MNQLRTDDIRIDPLANHLDLISLTCEWHLPEFDPMGDMDSWLRARTDEAQDGGIPCAWVVFSNDDPVGSVSLVESNMDTRRDLTPWLAALFVLPSHRGRGIGAVLVERCEREAVLAGVSHVYLYASKAVDYYRRLGWALVSQEHY
jgi:GNAT superfamily N-acetyltransferase